MSGQGATTKQATAQFTNKNSAKTGRHIPFENKGQSKI